MLHNSDVWMVFDAAPNYLFHYAYSKGIVGIYIGPTASFDFHSLLHGRKLNVFSLDAVEDREAGEGLQRSSPCHPVLWGESSAIRTEPEAGYAGRSAGAEMSGLPTTHQLGPIFGRSHFSVGLPWISHLQSSSTKARS